MCSSDLDFLILCRDEAAAEDAREHVADLLAAQGLRLDPAKSRIAGFEDSVRFLGHLFVRSLVLREAGYDDGSLDLPPPDAAERPVVAPSDTTWAGPWGVPRAERVPGLRVLYLTEAGRTLDVRNEAFVVREAEEEIFAVQPDGDGARPGHFHPQPAVQAGEVRHPLTWRG